jgi:hypothetical protein
VVERNIKWDFRSLKKLGKLVFGGRVKLKNSIELIYCSYCGLPYEKGSKHEEWEAERSDLYTAIAHTEALINAKTDSAYLEDRKALLKRFKRRIKVVNKKIKETLYNESDAN